uniref:Amino acid transporter transmembrane domain-containing protein n=1 Tax=Romanomermis culicivorax TaxID=13658 RepID=A0A915JE86_ROMCU
MMALAVFIALTLPDFNTLLELVGGTTLAATAYFFPGPFYLMLKSKKLEKPLSMSDAKTPANGIARKSFNDLSSSRKSLLSIIGHKNLSSGDVHVSEYILNAAVVICGVVGAVAAVYGVFSKGAKLETPCYLSGMKLLRHYSENATSCFALWTSNFTVAATTIDRLV